MADEDLTGSAVGHRSIAPGFKSQSGFVRMLFHLSLLVTFGLLKVAQPISPTLWIEVAIKQQYLHFMTDEDVKYYWIVCAFKMGCFCFCSTIFYSCISTTNNTQ